MHIKHIHKRSKMYAAWRSCATVIDSSYSLPPEQLSKVVPHILFHINSAHEADITSTMLCSNPLPSSLSPRCSRAVTPSRDT